MTAPAVFARTAINLQSHQTSNVSNVAQRAAVAALSGSLDTFRKMHVQYDRRRRLMHRLLSSLPGVDCPLSQGAFYAFPSVAGLLGRDIAGSAPQTSLELADLLLSEVKVAVVPGEAFGSPGHIRLSFAISEEKIEEGLSRVAELLS